MSRRLTHATTYARLGLVSIERVVADRLGLKGLPHLVKWVEAITPKVYPPTAPGMTDYGGLVGTACLC